MKSIIKFIGYDVTDKDALYAKTFSICPAFMAITSAETNRLVEVNEGFCKFLGYTREELIGWTWVEVGIIADHTDLNPGGMRQFEVPLISKSKEIKYASCSSDDIEIHGASYSILSGFDITERKKAEEALKESENRLKRAQEISHVGSWELDLTSNILTWSDEVYRIFGIPPQEFEATYEAFLDAVHPDDRAAVDEAYSCSIRDSLDTYEIKHRVVRRKTGEIRYVHEKCEHVRQSGRIIRSTGMVQDITERKEMEQALRDLASELEERVRERTLEVEQANRAKDKFLANMSHELRTPLAGVFGLTELLLQQERSNSVREELEMIRCAAVSVLTLLNDFLDLSRIERGMLEINPKPFELRTMLNQVVQTYMGQAAAKGIAFELSLNQDVPEQVLCDQDRLGQVLKNLLFNAIKFTDSGTIRMMVQAEMRSDQPDRLRFTVSDTGIGIPEEKIGEIFSSFTQVDSSYSKRFAGAGLGLAICKQLIELMGGEISVQSQIGKGSTFSFTIGFEKAEPVDSEMGDSLKLSEIPPISILLVEDNPVNRLVLLRALVAAGHWVVEAANGLRALEELKSNHFDLVLMDIQMPEMNGIEATRQIRFGGHGRPGVPIIALTAFAMKGDREKFLEAGMDGYVTKPVDFNELARTIKTVCRLALGKTA
jgi:PAS domain S-box-containing protein